MRKTFPLSLLTAAALLSQAPRAVAEIAIFSDGRAMKVQAHAVQNDWMQLTLPSKGKILVSLARIERIIEDEVIVQQAEVAVLPSLFPHRSWHYVEARLPFTSRYDQTIIEAARKVDVDPTLVASIIKAESDFDSRTISNKGARGLMQLMPGTADRFGVVDSLDPVQNIYGGTRYLHWLLEKFQGNVEYVVAAYNAGEGNIARYNGVPPFRETVEYVKRVAKHVTRAAAMMPTGQAR
ncbi:MAG TPA: lytic transglycosylase domain-containing protein [Thermoanaerobaculia bacterium]|nr:lytic transglycosylase domain-containing protein [Thermoanaerobaculia bacterium]